MSRSSKTQQILELDAWPKLASFSEFAQWDPTIRAFLSALPRDPEDNEALYRARLLSCIPEAERFVDLPTIKSILNQIRIIYWSCIFNRGYGSRTAEKIYQYACCDRCESLKAGIEYLAGNTFDSEPSNVEISYSQKDISAIGGVGFTLSIAHPQNRQSRILDLRVLEGECEWFITNSLVHTAC